MKAAAHRKAITMNRAIARTATSDVSRNALLVDSFKPSTKRANIRTPRSEMRQCLDAPLLAAPYYADQKAEAERDADSRQRTLRDHLFKGLLDRKRRILRGIHDRAAAFRNIVDRRIHIGARLGVTAARLFSGGAGERTQRFGELSVEGGQVVCHCRHTPFKTHRESWATDV